MSCIFVYIVLATPGGLVWLLTAWFPSPHVGGLVFPLGGASLARPLLAFPGLGVPPQWSVLRAHARTAFNVNPRCVEELTYDVRRC